MRNLEEWCEVRASKVAYARAPTRPPVKTEGGNDRGDGGLFKGLREQSIGEENLVAISRDCVRRLEATSVAWAI